MSYHSSHSRSNADPIGIIIALVVLISFSAYGIMRKFFLDSGKRKREEKLKKLAAQNHAKVIPYFNKGLGEGNHLEFFNVTISRPQYYNVMSVNNVKNGEMYVGEFSYRSLENGRPSPRRRRRAMVGFAVDCFDGQQSDDYNLGYEKAVTMCFLKEEGFNLPPFEMRPETFFDRANETLFGYKRGEDIDFEEDKEFSDTWWLTSMDRTAIPTLFNRQMRHDFMAFKEKDYRILGEGGMIYLLTSKAYDPEDYSKLVLDMISIQKILKRNRRFYAPPENAHIAPIPDTFRQTEQFNSNFIDNFKS